MTAHPGAFCAPADGTDTTRTGTPMVCSVGDTGGRARWRRNGPAPVRSRRRNTTGSAPLPVVDAGIRLDTHPVPAPAAQDTPAGPAPVDGRHASRPPKPNGWGGLPAPDAHYFHPDGPLGCAIGYLGADARIDMGDGEPLGDIIGDLATQVTRGELHPNDLGKRIHAICDRLPTDSRARSVMHQLAGDVDHPMTDPPLADLPADTPDSVRKLITDLHRIPLCRRDDQTEMRPLLDFVAQRHARQISAGGFRRQLEQLAQKRHESSGDVGALHIRAAFNTAIRELERKRW